MLSGYLSWLSWLAGWLAGNGGYAGWLTKLAGCL
jgi:hypothetical protein